MSRLFPYFFGEKQDIPRFSSYQKKNASPQEIRPFFILLPDFSMKKDTPPDVSFHGRTFGRRRLSCISSNPGRVCGRGEFYHLKDSSLRYNYNTFLLCSQYILNFLYKKERSCGISQSSRSFFCFPGASISLHSPASANR